MSKLSNLERRLNAALRKSHGAYVASGDLFKSVRDEKLWREEGFGSFRSYVFERWGISVKTAYALIQAADVAQDVPEELTQHHAQLLFRFTKEDRQRLAPEIAMLSAREATRYVLAEWSRLSGDSKRSQRRKPEPASELRTLMGGVQAINSRDMARVKQAIAVLPARERGKTTKRIAAARSALSKL